MGPRPFSHGNYDLASGDVNTLRLQWGRDLSVTETSPNDSPCSRGELASMGPRPFSHGNGDPFAGYAVAVERFNGAATFQSRKLLS